MNSSNMRSVANRDAVQVLLIDMYTKHQVWSTDQINQICQETGLNYLSVYKWYWDQKQVRGQRELTDFEKDYYKAMTVLQHSPVKSALFQVKK